MELQIFKNAELGSVRSTMINLLWKADMITFLLTVVLV